MKDILLSSSLLILVILLIRVIFRRTISRRAQYALWALVLLRLLMPFSVGSSPWNVASVMQEARETQTWETASALYQSHVPRMSYTRAYDQVTEEARNAGEDLAAFSDSELDDRAYVRMMSSLTVRDALHLMWYVGMGFMALLFLLANLRFAFKLRRTRVPLEGAGSRYPVYLCDDIPSPCLFGLCKPKIYVTSAAAKDPETLRYVIAHEETHARHLDPLWSLLRSLCLVIWWFDPLVWLAAHFSRIDCELACDEGVLRRLGEEKRIPYGETLLKLIPVGRAGNPVLTATTMTAGKRQMKDRILRIAEGKKSLVAALAAALVLAAVVCACTFTGAKEEPEPTETVHHTGQPATPAELMPAGEYESPGDYLASRGKEIKEVTCYAAGDLEEMTVPVLDTRVRYLNKVAEIPGLAPEGTLEWYDYLIEVKPDAEPGSITLLDGMTATEDGWYDLEGQGGHSLVLLRYPDGSYDALHDQANNDDYGGMYYYEETAEEMLYDWYVRTYRPDLPPWTLDLLPEGTGGNHPARRWDVDGWYLYIPISGWSEASSGGTARWVSRYGTGSSIAVRAASREELTAERPALAEGQAERYIEGENGKLWLVFTQYDPERITGSPEILDEPRLLEAMLESFTVPGGRDMLRRSWLHTVPPTITDRLREAADRIFGTSQIPAGLCTLSVEAEGRRDEYVCGPGLTWSLDLNMGYLLTDYAYSWKTLSREEIAGVDRDPAGGAILEIGNETDCFTVYAESGVLRWTERKTGEEHWLRPEPKRDFAAPIYDFFLGNTARYAEMYRPEAEITIRGTVRDYEIAARQMAEQFAAILLDRPSWYGGIPEGAAVKGVTVFDAYYGEDYPNFCFGMSFYLKLSDDPADPNRMEFEAGAGLGDPIPEGPYAGWYEWGSGVSAALEDGLWRFQGRFTGGGCGWLPYGVGYGFPADKNLTAEQLVELYFLTWGESRDWRVMYALAQKPAEEVLQAMEKRSGEDRQALLEGMERYNGEYGVFGNYGFFDPETYGIREEAPGFALLRELSEYTLADWDRLSRDGSLENRYEDLVEAALGAGQVRRDIYVMTAALHTDGVYTELLASILRDQYEADPDAWEEALAAFSDEEAGLLRQMAEEGGKGGTP